MERMLTREVAGLRCHILSAVPEQARPKLLVVLCHGFGAPGTDLVPLAPELVRRRPQLAQSVCFAFPEGPLSLNAMQLDGGRAWWPLDIEQITAAIERGELRDLRNEEPAGLADARQSLIGLVDELVGELEIEIGRVVLGGFSQGAMLATDVALRIPERPAGLCIFSGTLLMERQWRTLAERRGPMPVLQTHGYEDPLLPFVAAQWLYALLTSAGLPVEFLPFHGGHTISAEGVERLAQMLADRLSA